MEATGIVRVSSRRENQIEEETITHGFLTPDPKPPMSSWSPSLLPLSPDSPRASWSKSFLAWRALPPPLLTFCFDVDAKSDFDFELVSSSPSSSSLLSSLASASESLDSSLDDARYACLHDAKRFRQAAEAGNRGVKLRRF